MQEKIDKMEKEIKELKLEGKIRQKGGKRRENKEIGKRESRRWKNGKKRLRGWKEE